MIHSNAMIMMMATGNAGYFAGQNHTFNKLPSQVTHIVGSTRSSHAVS